MFRYSDDFHHLSRLFLNRFILPEDLPLYADIMLLAVSSSLESLLTLDPLSNPSSGSVAKAWRARFTGLMLIFFRSRFSTLRLLVTFCSIKRCALS